MKNLFFTALLLSFFVVNKTHAQIITGMMGEAVVTTQYSEVQGNPYLTDDWISGFVILDGQKAIANLKFDTFSNKILYQGKDGATLALKNKFDTFTLTPVTNEISNLKPLVFIDGLPAVDKQTSETFYQQIATGKTALYKFYKKVIDEQPGTSYTSATTRRFKSVQSYYVLKNNQMTEIQPGKKTFAKLFEDHAQQYDQFLKEHSISFRSDADLQILFNWYNSL